MQRPLGNRFRRPDPLCPKCGGSGFASVPGDVMHAEAFLEGTPVALYCLCSFDKLDPAVDGSDEQRAEWQARQLAGSIATCRRCGRESEITDLLRPFKFTFNAHRELPDVEFDLAFICPNCGAWRLVPGYALPDKRVHPPRDTDYSF